MLLRLAELLAVLFQTFVTPSIPFTTTPARLSMPPLSAMPDVSALAVFLIDMDKGRILAAKQADAPRPIASITKLMTALVVLDANPDWARPIVFEARDQRYGDSTRIMAGEELTMGDAWNLMLVSSSNDAASLLARIVGGSEEKFVEAMNKKARTIGLTRTHFQDPTGLEKGNISTAREVAILARAAFSFSKTRDAVTQTQTVFTPKGKSQRVSRATDQLLYWFRIPGVRIFGGKTGHIEESGYNLVFAAGDTDHEFIGVVLGSETNNARFEEMSKLLKWGFENVK